MIPPQWRATVKKIGDYDEDPTKVLAARGGQRAMVMQWVNQYNPDYKQDEFAVRSPTRKAFTTGTQGQQINAMNTAIGHIDQLSTLVDRLGNGAFTPGNQVWNTVQTMFGTDKVTNFDTLKDFLSGEVASILSKNGATVSGIAEAKEKINSSNSPQQLAGYIKTVIPVMGSKLASLDYQYKQAMGDDKFSALSPESKRILEKYGFDPSHPTLDGGGGPKQQPIPGVPGGVAELRNGRWIRVK
jgi:ribosomal protein L24